MGNQQSDQDEGIAFAAIIEIPIVNLLYAPFRSAAYACKGDLEKARSTFTETAPRIIPFRSPAMPDIVKGEFVKLSSILNNLSQGDIIEFDRGYYSHYALYIGNENVMNIRAESKKNKQSRIYVAKLEAVCKNSLIRVSNHDDVAMKYFGLEPQPPSEVYFSASCYNECTVPYEFLFRNCEYYCTFWRFGKGFSTQVCNISSTPRSTTVEEVLHQAINSSCCLVANITESVALAKYKAFVEPMCPWVEHLLFQSRKISLVL